jgi:hypothetical protein
LYHYLALFKPIFIMKHLLTTAILYCIAVFTTNGQNLSSSEPKTQDDILKNAAYVFDGKVIKRQSYIAADGEVYTSRIVEISKIRRGDLKIGTVEIISRYGCIARPCKNCPIEARLRGATQDTCFAYVDKKTGQTMYSYDNIRGKITYYCQNTKSTSYFNIQTDNVLLEYYDNASGCSAHSDGNHNITGFNPCNTEVEFEAIMEKYGLGISEKKKPKPNRKQRKKPATKPRIR